jgi:hypothetical protein
VLDLFRHPISKFFLLVISILNRKLSIEDAMNCSAFLPWLSLVDPAGSDDAYIFCMCQWHVATQL